MFKAINKDTSQEVTICASEWIARVDQLRESGRQDILICQECHTPVLVRAGEVNRWHFAHKAVNDCPIDRQSPELLAAREVLFKWLEAKYQPQGGQVTLEKKISAAFIPRPIDCWVEYKDQINAYWIIESRLPEAAAESLQQDFKCRNINATWLFLAERLHEMPEEPAHLRLSTAERVLMFTNDEVIGELYNKNDKFLHYIDAQQRQLKTFRSLRYVHNPQIFMGTQFQSALDSLKISPINGGFLHPGEYEKWHTAQAKLKEQREKSEREKRQALIPKSNWSPTPFKSKSVPNPVSCVPPPPKVELEINPVARCVICEQETRDYWWFNRSAGQCRCNDCARKGIYELPEVDDQDNW